MKQSLQVSRQGNEGREVVRRTGTAVSLCQSVCLLFDCLTYNDGQQRQAKERHLNSGQMQRDDEEERKRTEPKEQESKQITGAKSRIARIAPFVGLQVFFARFQPWNMKIAWWIQSMARICGCQKRGRRQGAAVVLLFSCSFWDQRGGHSHSWLKKTWWWRPGGHGLADRGLDVVVFTLGTYSFGCSGLDPLREAGCCIGSPQAREGGKELATVTFSVRTFPCFRSFHSQQSRKKKE